MKKNLIALHSRGYILILALIFMAVFTSVAASYLSYITVSIRSARVDVANIQALQLAEAGIDQGIYQLNQNATYTGETNTALGAGVFTVVVTNENGSTKRITATGYVPNATNPTATKKVTTLAAINSSIVSFHYGVQVGDGGVSMGNGSIIEGNLYSNGSVAANGTNSSGTVTGDLTVAGATHGVNGVVVNGTAWAHSLQNCTVGGDALYQSITGCTVSGTSHPGSADPDSAALPISDAQISNWEATAAAGGVTAGPYTISTGRTLGPQEINGDLTVGVGATLTLAGVVWVKGNITFGNNSTLTVAPTTGNAGAILIADVPGSTSTKGIVTMSNNMHVSGNGSSGSFPMVISTNTGSTAITMSNNSQSVILYAPHGTVLVSNGAGANQITGYGLTLSNNSTVTYVSGLQSQSFSNGPGGSWAVVPQTYSIVR